VFVDLGNAAEIESGDEVGDVFCDGGARLPSLLLAQAVCGYR
jgi:hypothetical protein